MNHYFRSASLGAFTLLTASVTYAQEPCGEDSCPAGYTCELTTYEVCSGGCAPSPSPGEEGDCSSFSCDTVSYESCQRAACETDADCGEEMVCHTSLLPSVPTAPTACPPEGPCEPTEPVPPTEPVELKQCTPRSELPCQDNSDCGDGFDCEPSVSCTCGGSAPSSPGSAPAPGPWPTEPGEAGGAEDPADPMPPVDLPLPTSNVDGGAAPPNPPDDCSCGPTGTNYCQMKDIACSSDADCPTEWTCVEGPGSCWADSEGNSGCESGRSQCYPSGPTSPGYPETPVGTPTSGGTPTVDGEVGQGPAPAPVPETPQGPQTPGAPGETPPRGNPESGPAPAFSFFGCSVDGVGQSSSSSAWMWLSLGLGAVFLRRRRSAV